MSTEPTDPPGPGSAPHGEPVAMAPARPHAPASPNGDGADDESVPPSTAHIAPAQRWLVLVEECHEFLAWGLRLFEMAVVAALMVGVASSAWKWWVEKDPTLPDVMSEFSKSWQGAVIVLLVLLIPTIRDLVERLKELPGGTKVQPRLRGRSAQRRNDEGGDR